MPLTSSIWVNHSFSGGLATDFGTTIFTPLDQTNSIKIPFLLEARNAVYTLNGGIRKAPGTTKFNAAVLSGASTVRGLFDYWRQGTGDSAVQKRIVHHGTVIYNDNADGVFASLFTGLNNTAIPNYATFDDILIIADSALADVPRSWDTVTAQNLAGTPPRFSFSVAHKNYQFAAGNFAFPSRLYYSVSLDPEDWVGGGSGSIDINPNDGDMITGLISHKNELVVFKGPYKGSIHRITGTSGASWARTEFISGLPLPWINSVFRFGDDIGWITTNGSVHSLKATAAYGDYNQAWLSYPIHTYLQENLNNNRARFFTSTVDPNRGYVWIGITPSGQNTNTRHLIMDYRFLSQNESSPRWSYWDSRAFASIALIRDVSRPRLMAGAYNGFVYSLDQASRTDNGTAINYIVETPSMTYGTDWRLKSLVDVGINLNAFNDNIVSLVTTRDSASDATRTVTQGAVGGLFDSGLFDNAVFGGAAYTTRFYNIENGGDFRSISYRFSDTVDSSDIELNSFISKVTPGGESQEN